MSGFAAVAELRLRLVLARLRGRGGVLEGVARIAAVVLAVPGALAFAALLGLSSFRLAEVAPGWSERQVAIAAGATLFGVWNAWTMVGVALADRDGLGLARLLVYPVAPARLYALGVLASLVADPFALMGAAALAGAWTGAALARPGAWLAGLALLLAAFALATVALVALLQELLARLARSRWRGLLALGLFGLYALATLATSGGDARLRAAAEVLRRARWLALPAALATEGMVRAYRGAGALAVAPFVALLVAAALLAGALAYRLALAAARSGGEGSAAGRGARRRGRGLLPQWLGPLLEKELRSLARHPLARLHLVVVPGFVAVLSAGPLRGYLRQASVAGAGGGAGPVLRALPLFGVALYVHLALQAFWLNPFGADRGGARALFLAPVAPERVLAAKNGAVLALAAALFLPALAVHAIAAGPPPAWAAASAALLLLGLAPLLHGAGNVVGILAPRAAPASFGRGGGVSTVAALAGMAALSGAGLVYAAPVAAALWWERPGIVPAAWAALAAASWAAWRAALPATGRLLARRREALLEAVCEDPTG